MKKKVLFISSTGGHLNEMLQLAPMFEKYDYHIITEKDEASEALKDKYKEKISFLMSTVDLNNYLEDGGCILFVVYIGNNGLTNKIYYVELTPIKLRKILEEAKEQKNKKNIVFCLKSFYSCIRLF